MALYCLLLDYCLSFAFNTNYATNMQVTYRVERESEEGSVRKK